MTTAPALQFNVPEIDCGHCVHSITEAIHHVDPAAQVQVDLETKLVSVGGNAGAQIYEDAIGDAGFEVKHA